MIYRFAEFELDCERGILLGPHGPISLRPRTFALLETLVVAAPALLARDQLLDRVWGHDALTPNVLPQAIGEIRLALGDNAQAPRLVGTQHRRGYRLLVPVIRHEPEGRAPERQSADLARLPEEPSVEGSSDLVPVHRRAWIGLGAVIGVMIGIALLASPVDWHRAGRVAAAPTPSVALVARTSLQDMHPALRAGPRLLAMALANDERIHLLIADGRMADPGARDLRWQVSLKEELGAAFALDVEWAHHAGQAAVSWSLIDLRSGRLVAAADNRDADPATAARDAGKAIRRALRVVDSDLRWFGDIPGDAAGRAAFFRGLAALAEDRPGAALAEFESVGGEKHPSPRLRLAMVEALRGAGEVARARAVAADLAAVVERMSAPERLRFEALEAELAHRPAEAADSYGTLARLLPENWTVRIALADAQIRARRFAAAEEGIALLESSGEAADANLRVSLLRGQLLSARRQMEAALLEFDRVMEVAFERNRTAIAARAGIAGAQVARAAGRLADARSRLETVLAMAGLPEPQRNEAQLQLGSLLRDLGDFAAASSELRNARVGFEGRGDRAGSLRAQIEEHVIASERGHDMDALARLESLESSISALGDDLLVGRWNNTLGVQALRNGNDAGAEPRLEAAAVFARRADDPALEAAALGNLGQVRARQRRMPEAEELWERALEAFRTAGDPMGEAITLGNLAAAASAQGRLERSEDLNHQALVRFRELEASQHLARTAYNLGLAVERSGRLAEAEALFEEALEAYRRGEAGDPLLVAAASLARVRVARADLAGAETALATVAAMESAAGAFSRSHLATQRGRIAQLRGDRDEARASYALALRLRQQDGRQGWIDASELDLLSLRLEPESGRLVRADAERIAARYARQSDARGEARGRLIEARALLVLRQTGEARSLAEKALASLAVERDAGLEMEAALTMLEVDQLDTAESAERLLALAREAEASGQALIAIRCRLAVDPEDALVRQEIDRLGLAGLLAGQLR